MFLIRKRARSRFIFVRSGTARLAGFTIFYRVIISGMLISDSIGIVREQYQFLQLFRHGSQPYDKIIVYIVYI